MCIASMKTRTGTGSFHKLVVMLYEVQDAPKLDDANSSSYALLLNAALFEAGRANMKPL